MTTLLVANRGEIAVRILATASLRGLRTIAVYPADDADSAHVAAADEAVLLPGAGPAAYLDVAAVVEAARSTASDLLHPGYGFLAESAALAAACAAAHVHFVGPSREALQLFGDKTAARDRARTLGIPVLEGTAAPTGLRTAQMFLAGLGPTGAVMVKAVAGGGGRGTRPVREADDLPEAMRRCSAEAEAAFGDGALYVEQLLSPARHVEVQVLADGSGTPVVLGDRDCSLQRRRQKLVEIAPAPGLSAPLRSQLHAAAARLVAAVPYRGLATVEFLVGSDAFAFLEVNPRLQVEHTVTEEVTGLDLVGLALDVAGGATLAELGVVAPPADRGVAVQVRVNAELLRPDGSVEPGAGILHRFALPAGRGVRVDTAGYPGYRIGPRYDSLLAKVVVTGADLGEATARAQRALAAFDIDGVPTTIGPLQALLTDLADSAVLDIGYVDAHLDRLANAVPYHVIRRVAPSDATLADADAAVADEPVMEGASAVAAPQAGVVVAVMAEPGDDLPAGAELMVLEAMKMHHAVIVPGGGRVEQVRVAVGDTVEQGVVLAVLSGTGAPDENPPGAGADPDHIRTDLAEVLERRGAVRDEGRACAVERRREARRNTARENVSGLVDPGSLVEYGALTIAAQRRRRELADLIHRTPADGLITATATVGGAPVAVMAYDYTVLAGTQGVHNHRKTDRLLAIADERRLPLVVFAEGGGGRPGDTDTSAVAQLDVPTFRTAARLAGRVPTLAVVSGYCFAGNAALAGVCDVIIGTEGSSLGMGGPAMIEGGGLGVVAPNEVGPMAVQTANGVVDLLVPDDAAAVAAARSYLSYFTGPHDPGPAADQRLLRHMVPENRVRAYAVRPVLETMFDTDTVLELRAGFGRGMVTALARLGGRPVGVLANDPGHLGGAIDGDAADKATRFLRMCQARGLAVVTLCDTPGFMVGPEAERDGAVRRFGEFFVAGAHLTVPLVTVVLRKAYGLGAMAMAGGSVHTPDLTVAWPTGEFGGMGLEGAVRLGFRRELEAIENPVARRQRFEELVADYYDRGRALSVATVFELDDVIDPADTRKVLTQILAVVAR
ncbi:carboxyl transferase domain-containing protein [Pseudonocardia nematodicida]|uniref:acetyl-CoA carboxylase n=1 Tax=Pseudonocardia nematodicida TaxID=1206997 RepID=A0ABV1KDW6_9PSEU